MEEDNSFYVYIFRNAITSAAFFVGISSNLYYGYNHYRNAYRRFESFGVTTDTQSHTIRLKQLLEENRSHSVEIFRSNLAIKDAKYIKQELLKFYKLEVKKEKLNKRTEQIYQEQIIEIPRIPRKEVDEIEVVKFYSLLNNCLTREEILQNLWGKYEKRRFRKIEETDRIKN